MLVNEPDFFPGFSITNQQSATLYCLGITLDCQRQIAVLVVGIANFNILRNIKSGEQPVYIRLVKVESLKYMQTMKKSTENHTYSRYETFQPYLVLSDSP